MDRRRRRGSPLHRAEERRGRIAVNRLATVVCLGAATLVVALVACADSNDDGTAEQARVDASTVLPVADAGNTDASVDDAADASADVEAGARICSDDGFCHS